MITDTADTHVSTGSAVASRRRTAVRAAALARWLVPILGLAWVLTLSYGALTHKRYPGVNGSTGELLAGESVGQTFVSRYSNLSGVELQIGTYGRGQEPSPAPIVLHLKRAPGESSDIATVTLPAGRVLGENAWHLFSFPPLPDSRGKSYYIEVESPGAQSRDALTLFSWKPTPVGDIYAGGALYRDGASWPDDLVFGLRYSPAPWDLWRQVSTEIVEGPGGALMPVLLFLCLALGLWVVLRAPALLAGPGELRRWLLRRSLSFALAVALLNGALYALLVPPWQGPDEYAHFAYAALLDKHWLDDHAAQAAALAGKERNQELIGAVNASMERNDFTRHVAGFATPGAPVETSHVLFQEVRQPPAYYLLSALGMRAARLMGIAADPYTDPDAALLTMRFVSVGLGLVVVALAWLAAALLSTARHGWLRLLLPLTVGLMPMRAFTDAVANNDVMAEVAVSALFVTLVALLRWPGGLRAAGLAALALLLAAASAGTKSTAVAASLPMLALGLTVWMGMLAGRALRRRGHPRPARFALPAALLVLLLGGVALAAAVFERESAAAGWASHISPLERPLRVKSDSARDGSYVLQLDNQGKSGLAHQVMVPALPHPGMRVTFSGWIRLSPEPALEETAPTRAMIAVREGQRDAGLGVVTLQEPGVWVPITATAHVAASAERLSLWVTADPGTRPVQFDNLSLDFGELSQPWSDPVFWPTLINPSGEDDALTLRPWAAAIVPDEVQQIAELVLNPLPFDKRALWMRFADVQYRSFWGYFGWFSVPLPTGLYTAIGLLTVVALGGLASIGARRLGRWSAHEWLALISVVSLVAAIAIGFARQMMQTAVAVPAYPHGRYLFVLAIPIAWLLVAGFAAAWSGLWAWGRGLLVIPARRVGFEKADVPDPNGPARRLSWGAWLWLNALVLFAAYCLLVLVLPYYQA